MVSKLHLGLSAIGNRVLLAVLLVLSLAFVTVYFREGEEGYLHSVQNLVAGLASPFKFLGSALGAGTGAVAESIEESSTDDSTLEGLRAQRDELLEELAKLRERDQEALRLQALLELKDTYFLETASARVVGRSINTYEQTVTIDKGSDEGIITGLPVMGPSGVVGQVISATPFTSEVRLLGDPLSGVAVLIQSSRAEGIVKGSLEGLLYLEINDDAQVQVGDFIITSGLGGSYFKGLMVGVVVKVDENSGGVTRKIVVAPNEETGPLEEVLVVKKMNSEGDATINKRVEAPSDEEGTSEG